MGGAELCKTMFKSVVHRRRGWAIGAGVILCTAAAGGRNVGPSEIAAAVHHGLQRMQGCHCRGHRLRRPLHDNLSPHKRKALANVLLTQYIGLRVLARSCLPLGIVEQSRAGR